jgi:hypothetical protein
LEIIMRHTYSVTYGEVPGYLGYVNWLVFRDGRYLTDFGDRYSAETYAAAMRLGY